MIKNLIFDFGGVVVDIYWDAAVRRFKELGLDNAETVLDRYHQNGLFLELEEGLVDAETFREKLSAMCGRTLSTDEVEHAWLGFFNGVSTAKLKLLEELKRKYKMYLLSNTNPYVMGWARSSRFSEYGKSLDQFFDKLYLSYQIGYTKPDKRIFEAMVADSGILPEESLFVDDGKSNIDTAKSLGFSTLLVEEHADWSDTIAAVLRN